MAEFAIQLEGVDKRFGSVHANRNINLSVPSGTIHGIIGENGAGKSTLMNILYGLYRADSGKIYIDGTEVTTNSPQEAIAHGIGMVHQHFQLVENFTVLENLILGNEGGSILNRGVEAARNHLLSLERQYGLHAPLDQKVESLPVGIQQKTEILKALFRGAHILILDEPTGVLTPQEADDLFDILRNLREQGRTIILITHKLREILSITDNVSVMRHGEMVAQRQTSTTDKEELAELMVGRKVLLNVQKSKSNPTNPVLAVDNLTVKDQNGVERVKSVSFVVRRGEIVGVAGVSGNGQTELLEAITGIREYAQGSLSFLDKEMEATVDKRIGGIGHVPEDRLRMGLVRGLKAYENAILGYQDVHSYSRHGFLRFRSIVNTCREWMRGYDVRPADAQLEATSFSGGNQQKLVIAREIEHDPDLLIVGQPTRGVDIGAIEFIHKRLIAMREAGKAVLLVSVELEEILSLSDRILVMFDGRIVGEVSGEDANERSIGLLMAGISEDAA